MSTVEWAGAITATKTYNSKNVTTDSTTCYYQKNRKMRFTINDNSFLQSINIVRAYMTFELSSHYWNDYTIVYTGGALSGEVDTVFPKNTSGSAPASGMVAEVKEKPAYVCFYPIKTYYFDITETIKYAKANYSGTWYLWQSYSNDDGNSTVPSFKVPKIYIETTKSTGTKSDLSTYVYESGKGWVEAIPYICSNGVWQIASSNVYGNKEGWKEEGGFATITWPTASQGKNNTDIACESSQYADNSDGYYKAVCALGLNKNYGWKSSANSTNPWIQVHLPHDAYNLSVTITNSTDQKHGPLTGRFYYTNRYNMETERANMLDTGVTFARADGATASTSTTHNINNSYPIRNIMVSVDTWHGGTKTYCCIGKLEFTYSYRV